jgi:hypothetical protein
MTMSDIHIGITARAVAEAIEIERKKSAAEIERLQAAKRRALAIADERAKEANALRAALRSARCPGGGFNGMPKDAEPTVGLCLDHKVCGCDLGAALEQKAGK